MCTRSSTPTNLPWSSPPAPPLATMSSPSTPPSSSSAAVAAVGRRVISRGGGPFYTSTHRLSIVLKNNIAKQVIFIFDSTGGDVVYSNIPIMGRVMWSSLPKRKLPNSSLSLLFFFTFFWQTGALPPATNKNLISIQCNKNRNTMSSSDSSFDSFDEIPTLAEMMTRPFTPSTRPSYAAMVRGYTPPVPDVTSVTKFQEDFCGFSENHFFGSERGCSCRWC